MFEKKPISKDLIIMENKDNLKKCNSCKELKLKIEFSKESRNKDKLNYYCKECEKKKRKKRQQKYRDYNLKNIINFKGTKKCSGCKEIKLKIEFNEFFGNKDGLDIYCKECNKNNCKKQRQKNKKNNLKNGINYEGTQKCLKCKEIKTKTKFSENLFNKSGLHYYCKECLRFKNIFHKYNITKEEYLKMIEQQNNKCYICKIDFDSIPTKQIHVDHNKKTDKVRSILCMGCNTGIGQLKEKITFFKEAIKYLKEFNMVNIEDFTESLF